MNGSFVILGFFAVSMVMVSFIAYRMSLRFIQPQLEEPRNCQIDLSINSSLEEDFKDILSCLPLDRINEIFYDYLMYDRQIANTYSFIDDQAIFMLQEFQKMPHTNTIIGYLRDMGLRVEHWQSKLLKYWKNLPRFERTEPSIASGGFTVMIEKMMQLLPRDELYKMLSTKAKYSEYFKVFMILLRSPIIIDMCQQINKNSVINRHLHWAIEADIEAIFALELVYALHLYLTEGLT